MDQVESSSPHRRVLAYVDKGTPFTKSCNFSSKLLPNRGCTLGLGESRFVSSVYCDTKSTSHTWATLKLRNCCCIPIPIKRSNMQQEAFDVWHAALEAARWEIALPAWESCKRWKISESIIGEKSWMISNRQHWPLSMSDSHLLRIMIPFLSTPRTHYCRL